MDHPAFDDTNPADRRSGSFARLAASGRPPVDRILLALADEFRPADGAGALDQLDELARGLFGIASLSIEEAGTHLIAAVRRDGFAPGAPRVEGLMLDRVLRDRRGHPALLAAVYHEVARRAGMRVSLFTAGRDWFVGSEEAGEPLLVAHRHLPPRPATSLISAGAVPTGSRMECWTSCAVYFERLGITAASRTRRGCGRLLPVPRGLTQSLSEEQQS